MYISLVYILVAVGTYIIEFRFFQVQSGKDVDKT